MDSQVRETAIMLSVMLDVDPESDQVAGLVERLRRAMKFGAWQTTQENAFAIQALGKYARRMGEPATGQVEVVLPDGTKRTFDAKELISLTDVLPGQSVQVLHKGTGTLYVFWHAEGTPISGTAEEEDLGMEIRRTLLDHNGIALADAHQLEQGKLYQIRLELDMPMAANNIAIVDLLPGGLEIEDPNLKDTASTSGQERLRQLYPQQVERRDDRMILFTRASRGKWAYRYAVRAVTAGEFVLPATDASCMYDPGRYSVHGLGKIRVSKAE